jgi:hypothetical protein
MAYLELGYVYSGLGEPSLAVENFKKAYDFRGRVSTATPLGTTSGTKAYCATDDGVVRTHPAGTITLVPDYATCQTLVPLSN